MTFTSTNAADRYRTAIFGLILIAASCKSLPQDETETISRPAHCMDNLVQLSGVSNHSGVLLALQRAGIDEHVLSDLDYGTADGLLKTYGIVYLADRHEILKCVYPGLKSSSRSPCFNHRGPCGHGVCRFRRNGDVYRYKCQCDKGYAGRKCQRELNECELHQPCKHGATCEDRVNNYTCHCAPGYYGKHCETDRNECASAPCFHGNCTDVINGYRCECHAGYTGDNCESDIDECHGNPCHHGDCKDGINFFLCDCHPGYTGPRCEKDINECSSSPCQNFGTCHDQVNGYMCQCFNGYKGRDCETEWLNETTFLMLASKSESKGPVYIRWGRATCPSEAKLVYNGSAAASYYGHSGSGSNPICLPDQPIYGRYSDHRWGSVLYGAEYEFSTNAPFPSSFHDKNIPCAVCMARGKTVTIMLPARNVCPGGWHREYHGYIMSEHFSHRSKSQYLCFDDSIEAIPGRDANTNGALFYPVSVDCGYGLPCPPFVSGRELTCSVCSN